MDSTTNLQSTPSILDLSQRVTTDSVVFIDNWTTNSPCDYSDAVGDEFSKIESTGDFNIESSLTDQYQNLPIKDDLLSDTSKGNQSKLDLYLSVKKPLSCSTSRITIHDLEPCLNSSPYCSSNFLWSKYFSLINERSVSDEFFDHYLSSIHSGLEIEMKLEYCYDLQRDLYWLTQIQLVSHCLVYLHYIGVPDDDTSNDFWANIYDQRCHPIGWCRENSKLMLPPPILNKRTAAQPNISVLSNGFDKHFLKNENEQIQTPSSALFNKDIGLNPIEQLKIGTILELQDIDCPWTLWFVRIIDNKGGRLHLRYVISTTNGEDLSSDIHIFYLDWRVHLIGWTKDNSSIYSYELPKCLSIAIDKQALINFCSESSRKQFLPSTIFRDQEQIRKHRFQQGMKLEIFDTQAQNIYVGQIGQIYNEFYFEVCIDNEHQTKFIAHATHPYILPPHWAAEHRFALMRGKGVRQSEDYWNSHREKSNENDLASERCFHLITLNSTGNNRVEPGMKMEMILTIENRDLVGSVTLIHVADHLMWLKIDQQLTYHVLPINSLEVFPVGWGKFNHFEFLPPIDYQIRIRTFQQDQSDLFSSVTHQPKIPRVYLHETYQLTLHINIRCFSGPNLCSSRLARIPSQFGPGPYDLVLIDMFHHLLSVVSTSTNTLRALRRLEHSTTAHFHTKYIKAAKRASKLIRPISFPKDPQLVYKYLRHVCTQFEACPNLISMKQFEQTCPDQCQILINTFAHSFHSKHKRTQPRTVQNRQRKQKSLLCLLKPNSASTTTASITEESPPNELISEEIALPDAPPPPPGSDRKTRGFRVHIEPRTHTVTRTNRKQKLAIKQEPMEIEETTSNPIKESKRSRMGRPKRSSSPSLTTNILSNPTSPGNKTRKKRRSSPSSSTDAPSSSTVIVLPKIETSPLTYPIPLLNTQNPVTWNVNDVCSYLNQSGCSFALKTIQEQEIDGAALLLLDDLPKVQDLLEFKLGPAVKFCHVVEQLRTQVIDTFHSSPSLKTPSRLSTTNTS